MGTRIDGIELEILWQRLIAIMDEVDTIIVKTTFSTILRESRDFACILAEPSGLTHCQSQLSTANFSAVFPLTAAKLLERYPIDTLNQGDVLATNDPWFGTGHLPDYILLVPIFWRGRVVACMGTVSHMSDVGGHPGEIEGEDVFSEGLRMRPFKLYEQGEENPLAFDVIGANCRAPNLLLGDLRAMAGALRIGSERVREFLQDQEADDFDALAATISDRSEQAMRRAIDSLPDGAYEYGLDIDGYIEPIHLHVTVNIQGSEAIVDYTGTSLESRHGAINSSYHSTRASSVYAFKCALVPEVPNNEALFRPIRIVAPKGSILNAQFPIAVKARAKTTNNVNQVISGALWSVFGNRVQASNGAIWPLVLKGEEKDLGRYIVDMLPHGGRGGLPSMDGMVPVAYPNNSTITPCEVLESQAPILFCRKELRPDSGGAGRYRGGLGQIVVFKHVGKEAGIFSLTPDRITTLPQGLDGGGPGEIGAVYINGRKTFLFPAIDLHPNDIVELHIAGGGGFGPPSERSLQAIQHDISMGYVSLERARHDYQLTRELTPE